MRLLPFALWAMLALAGSRAAPGQTLSDSVRDRLRDRVAQEPAALRRLYEGRDSYPAWSGNEGLSPRASAVAALIHHAASEGLPPQEYAVPALRFQLDPDSLADLDVRLSRAVLAYAADLATGRVDPAAIDTDWSAAAGRSEATRAVAEGLDSWRLPSLLESLAPPYPAYGRLRLALAHYRNIAALGGWPAVPGGAVLIPGDTGAGVPALRTRLAVDGDLSPGAGTPGARYDSALEQAVRRFQTRHGLEADGHVGPSTLTALNVPVEARIRQIEVNLERWRWLPREPGDRYIMVNTAAAELQVVEAGRAALAMRVIVGRRDWPTPLVSARGAGLLFGPAWYVPRAIAVQEILPAVRRNPEYLARERIQVFPDSGGTVEVDPAAIDWSQVTDSTFAFQLRREPGATNPLGGVKLVAPNRFEVYIHDTPARALFRERVRTFSHGCVRVERAADLATYLLGNETRWPGDSVRAAMAQSRERWVPLPSSVLVLIAYWTAWADDDGTVQFRDDVYGWDTRLAEALARPRAERRRFPRPMPMKITAASSAGSRNP